MKRKRKVQTIREREREQRVGACLKASCRNLMLQYILFLGGNFTIQSSSKRILQVLKFTAAAMIFALSFFSLGNLWKFFGKSSSCERTITLIYDAVEELLWPRVLGIERRLVCFVERIDIVNVLSGPPAMQEGLYDVTNAIEDNSRILLILVVTFPELAILKHHIVRNGNQPFSLSLAFFLVGCFALSTTACGGGKTYRASFNSFRILREVSRFI